MHLHRQPGIRSCDRAFSWRYGLGKGLETRICGPFRRRTHSVSGAGPSDLSAAYLLTRLGHGVEIHEAGPVAGGMIHFGISEYRMPRTELAAEIYRIQDMGVNHRVEDVLAEKENGNFDAVFIAGGDTVPSERSVTIAVGHGIRAPRDIDGYLRGAPDEPPPKHSPIGHEKPHLKNKPVFLGFTLKPP